MPTYRNSTVLDSATAADLFAWHARPGAFDRLNPPWDPVEVVSRSGVGLEIGARLELAARVGPVRLSWVSVHTACDPPNGFIDEQQTGPFRTWRHEHRFEDGPDGVVLTDEIAWETPLGSVGAALGGVPARLGRAFRFRHRRTANDLARHAVYRDRPRLRVLVSGASGLVGTALTAFLDAGGHDVVPIQRNAAGFVLDDIEGFDAVVHLAGASIADTAWNEAGRALLRSSRIDRTRQLCEALARLERPPKVLISGSAVGYYGDASDGDRTEDSPPGKNFVATLCRDWEAAADPARAAGIRVVTLRTGYVMSARGGVLGALLPLFRLGAGGPVGSGTQAVPWIHLDDEIGLIHEAIFDDRYAGPLNATGPAPVTQAEQARTLGRVLGRPAFAPGPAFAVRMALGRDKADELALQGQQAVPAKALALGYRFDHADLESALMFELGHA